MTQDEKKKAAAERAIDLVKVGMTLGVGTGTTVNMFIDALAHVKHRLEATVASSEATASRLKSHGIQVLELNSVDGIDVYIDGADEATRHLQLIKGGGGALTREKVLAAAAETFVCIVDESKLVGRLGGFPLPVEVIPMARSYVARRITRMGGNPFWRDGFITDNGHHVLDVHNFEINEPIKLETELNQIPGVVTNGLFALRPADQLLVGTESGVDALE